MAYVKLGAKAVGSIVKIKVNGTVKDFIIVHQGKPSSVYDNSCDGTWVLMKDIYTTMSFGTTISNAYANSKFPAYLNGTFYNLIDSEIRDTIKQVELSSSLSTKVFLLSGTEAGFSGVDNMITEGARLDYFDSSSKRIAYNGSSAAVWWLRSSYYTSSKMVWTVNSEGEAFNYWLGENAYGIRPAFVLPSTLVIADNGTLSTNGAPEIVASSTTLGKKNTPFNFAYTVTDIDSDTLTVTEKLDDKTTKTRTGVASGTALTFEQASTADGFQRILNGSHTIKITANDGKESTSLNATFTKSVTSASVTMTTPLAVDGDITIAILQVTGSIPDDAVFKAEVTNNANDPSPVWQDATEEVQKGTNIVFANSTAANGAAFNFRISVERGASGEGGYIETISGAFQ